MTKRTVMLRPFTWLLFMLAALGSINLGIWVVDRDPPIEYEGARSLSDSVAQGGSIEVEFTVFRKRICPSETKRWLYDSSDDRHSIPQFTTGLRLLAGRETYRRTITIPSAAATGPARYEVSLVYRCNPLHSARPITVRSPAIRFDITPAQSLPLPDGDDTDG